MLKFKDVKISEDIMTIVAGEVERIKGLGIGIEAGDLIRLEKATKIYALLMSSTRENIKSGAFGKMSLEELEKLDTHLDGSDDSDESDE